MEKKILEAVDACVLAVESLKAPSAVAFVRDVATLLADTFKAGGKVLAAGNGGSLCDAAHFAEELTGFFRKKRRALPAISLTEPGHLTCVANDVGFEAVFSRGIEAYGVPGDVFIGLTTSGNSENIVHAFHTAKKRGLKTVAFLGKDGGQLKGVADLELIIGGFSTSDRIQEAHMAAIHMSIEMLELILFPEVNRGEMPHLAQGVHTVDSV